MSKKRICVYCGSRSGTDPGFVRLAENLGKTLVAQNFDMVYGGGKVGLMGVVASAVMRAGGKVTGVIPEDLFAREVADQEITNLKIVKTMHERKALMENLSDAFIAMPGGWGTLDELFEILTWKQLGIHRKPIGILNWNGFFDPLLQQMDQMIEAGFVLPEYKALVFVESDVESLFEQLNLQSN